MSFQEARPILSSVKFAIEGPPKGGKTFTALLCAEYLAKIQNKKIAVVDTERGTDWYAKAVPARKAHPEAFKFDALYTRSLAVMRQEVLALDPKVYGVVIIDSMTHFWEAARAAYTGPKEGGQIPMYAWTEIKRPYKDVVDFLIANRMDVFVLGREGDRYEVDVDGKMVQVGKKMKAEGETPYEFDTLIRIEGVETTSSGKRTNKKKGGDGKKSAVVMVPTAFVVGDRTGCLPAVIEWPTAATLVAPIVPFLDRTGDGVRMETSAAATKLDAELFAGDKVDGTKVSADLLAGFKARIKTAKTVDDLLGLTEELAAGKAKMIPEDIAEMTRQYKDRRASLDPKKVQDRERADLIALIAKSVEGWDLGSVERIQKKVWMGRTVEAWEKCSLVELRALAVELAKLEPAGMGGR